MTRMLAAEAKAATDNRTIASGGRGRWGGEGRTSAAGLAVRLRKGKVSWPLAAMSYGWEMMEELLVLARDPHAWAALATLVIMEVVLGIDNLIFISILTNKLPEEKRSSTRRIGIGLAVFLRLGLLSGVAFIVQLTTPIFSAVRSWLLLA